MANLIQHPLSLVTITNTVQLSCDYISNKKIPIPPSPKIQASIIHAASGTLDLMKIPETRRSGSDQELTTIIKESPVIPFDSTPINHGGSAGNGGNLSTGKAESASADHFDDRDQYDTKFKFTKATVASLGANNKDTASAVSETDTNTNTNTNTHTNTRQTKIAKNSNRRNNKNRNGRTISKQQATGIAKRVKTIDPKVATITRTLNKRGAEAEAEAEANSPSHDDSGNDTIHLQHLYPRAITYSLRSDQILRVDCNLDSLSCDNNNNNDGSGGDGKLDEFTDDDNDVPGVELVIDNHFNTVNCVASFEYIETVSFHNVVN